MKETTLARIAIWIAALFVAVVSEFFPMVGFYASALFFPQGFHSDHGDAFFILALVFNFVIFFAATFFILRFFLRGTIAAAK